uniref:Histone deacetylase 10 n=1 Tax=Astyanax mexicanus TaxID=7994 RepID=A0A8B9L8L2_ASTMX
MSGTALIYDEEMSRYQLLWDDPVCAIEIPERLTRSYEAVKSAGLEKRCVPVSVREGTEEEILLYHSKEYLEQVKQTPSMSVEELKTFTQQFGDVYFHPVRNKKQKPPGHHSQRSAANGFCVFNNVAIAALYAKKHYNLNRVLIVDWDVHHGQGVQYCFEEDPSVLYFSWHRYEHKSFWPNLDESDYNTVGKGKGTGFNINVPWNKVGMTNSDYLSVFFHVLLPAAYEFDPELVLVSAGFDSAIGDPEGHMCATPEIFGHLTHLLMSLARGKLCVVLEGGYNLTSLTQSVCQTMHSLLGDPTPSLSGIGSPCPESQILEPSTKRCRVENTAEENKEEENTEKEKEEKTEEKPEDIKWPEPLPRPAPPVQTVVTSSTELESLPKGCQMLGKIPQKCIEEAEKIRLAGQSRASVMQAVIGLLLPLAYEFSPDLVLQVLTSSSGLEMPVWAQVSSLLQGLAQGRTLALLQGCDKDMVGGTCSSLSGSPAPILGPLGHPVDKDVEFIEKQRQRLQKKWGLLRNSFSESGTKNQDG